MPALVAARETSAFREEKAPGREERYYARLATGVAIYEPQSELIAVKNRAPSASVGFVDFAAMLNEPFVSPRFLANLFSFFLRPPATPSTFDGGVERTRTNETEREYETGE